MCTDVRSVRLQPDFNPTSAGLAYTNQRLEQPRPLARRTTARLCQTIGAEGESAVLTPGRNDLDPVTGGGRRPERVVQVFFDLVTANAHLAGE